MKDEDLTNYYASDLEYAYVLLKINELKVHKNLTITTDMIKAWYVDFLKWGWKTRYFEHRFEMLKKFRTYGDRLEIADWMNAEELYSEQEMNQKIRTSIESKIRNGLMILQNSDKIDFDKSEINIENVKLAAAYEVDKILDVEKNRVINEFIEGEKGTLLQKISTRRKRLEKLTPKQKEFIIRGLIKNEYLDSRVEIPFAVKNIKYFVQNITEYDIKAAIDSV